MFRLPHILLLLFFIYEFLARATNSQNILPREEAPSNCVDSGFQRTLFNIIWGCLSTTIICAWTAVHPNIPPREGPLKGTLRRLELMFWAIIAPEILPSWAINQRLAAMTIRDIYNEAKGYEPERSGLWKTLKGWFQWHEITGVVNPAWTLRHGHFLIMGGIHLVEPVDPEGTLASSEATPVAEQPASSDGINVEPKDPPSVNADTERGHATGSAPEPEEGRTTILTLEMLRELVKDPEFKIRLTEAEITDKAKGDVLSKVIFMLQSSWFIVQCLARVIQDLNLTQLELTTLALASLNGITLILWWDKPLGAQTPVRVYLKRKLTDVERNVQGRGQSYRSDIFNGSDSSDSESSESSESNHHWALWFLLAILGLVISPILALGLAFSVTLLDILVGSTSFPVDATHVPTFYVPEHRYSDSNFHMWNLLITGTIFGGIHCAGWNLPFPTSAEQKIWRVASLAVTIIPIVIAFFAFISGDLDDDEKFKDLAICKFFSDVATVVVVILMVAYASARLVLLGQAVALLRHLVPSAFTVVDWIKFYPHYL